MRETTPEDQTVQRTEFAGFWMSLSPTRSQIRKAATVSILLVVLFLAGFSVFTASVSPVVADSNSTVEGTVELDIDGPDDEFEAGEEDVLVVEIDNYGEVLSEGDHPQEVRVKATEARATNVDLTETDAPIDVRSGEQGPETIESWEAGDDAETAEFAFEIFVEEDADPGTYDVDVNVTYSNVTVESYEWQNDTLQTSTSRERVNETHTITLEIEDEAQFEVDDVEHNIQVDESGNYTLEITNSGTLDARDVVVTTEATDQDIFFGSGGPTSERSVGDWDGGETKSITYRAGATDEAITEAYPVDLTFEYDDSDGDAVTQTEQTALEPLPRQQYTVDRISHNISVGDDGPLELELTNRGPKDVENATITVNTGDPSITFQDADGGSTTTETFVSDWTAGETKTVTLRTQVGSDAVARNYTMEASISARDTQDEQLDTRTREFGFEPEPKQRYTVGDVTHDVVIGDDGIVQIDVRNHGPQNVTNATVSLTTNDPALTFEDAEGGSTTTQTFVDDWKAGENKTLRLRMGASNDAVQREYAVDLAVAARDEDDSELGTRTREFGIEPLPRQTYTVENVTHDVPIGDNGVLSVEMTNHGPKNATGASVELSTNDPSIVFGGGGAGEAVQIEDIAFEAGEGGSPSSEAFVGEWDAGETKTLLYRTGATEEALERSYTIDATVESRDDNDDQMSSRTRQFGFQPHAEQTFDIDSVESSLHVGEDGDVVGTVTNRGDQPVENVVVLYDSDIPNVYPRDTQYAIGQLAPDESEAFVFRIGLGEEAEPGPRAFEFQTRYRNHEDDVRLDDSQDLFVDVEPKRDAFAFEPVDASFFPGESGMVELTVENTLDERVENVRVKLFTNSPLDSDDDEVFVRSLDPGERSTIAFDLSVGSAALAKDYPVSLDVRYDDERGDTKLSGTFRVPVEVVEPDESGVPWLLVAGIFVVLLVIGFVFRERVLGALGSAGQQFRE